MASKLKTTALLSAACLAGCSGSQPPLATVEYVDLDRFMGNWYVIANIPTFIEKDAFNATESYHLNEDGTIATTFTYREGSFDGEIKEYNPKGFVQDKDTNAVWGMRFIWPVKADYRIIYLTSDYTQTVIGRNKRDYVWLMARKPHIPEADYEEMVELIERVGYDVSKIQKVPQKW